MFYVHFSVYAQEYGTNEDFRKDSLKGVVTVKAREGQPVRVWIKGELHELEMVIPKSNRLSLADFPVFLQGKIQAAIDLDRLLQARKIAENPNNFPYKDCHEAIGILSASEENEDKERANKLQSIFPQVQNDSTILLRFVNNSGGLVECPDDMPIIHFASWRKYRTNNNGWAKGGELIVPVVPKAKLVPCVDKPRLYDSPQLYWGEYQKRGECQKSYTHANGREFKARGDNGCPSYFDWVTLSWLP